jgi:hemerythrin
MALLNWNNSYTVCDEMLDNQHKKLVSIINDLFDALKEGKGNEVQGSILNELVSYTQTHFRAEEEKFKRTQYGEVTSHLAEHKDFVAKILDFKRSFDSGKIGLSIEIMNFLKDWLINHIKGTDKGYVEFLN